MKGDSEISLPVIETKNIKPRYLSSKKKGPFDHFFETLNIEISENRDIIRKMYMAIGGLLTEGDIFPEKASNKNAFMIEEEIQNKMSENE